MATSKMIRPSFSRLVQAQGWRYRTHGGIDRVLKFEEFDVPFDRSGDRLLVRPLAAPVTRLDVQAVQGSWAFQQPTFPAVAGNEAVAEVLEVGRNANTTARPGDLVIPLTPNHGTWATATTFPAAETAVVPKSIPLEYASSLAVAPFVAYNLIQNAGLDFGDWIIQNGANGTVGSCVISLAKAAGLNTINVVRQRAGADDVVERLAAMGGNLVVTDDYLRRRAAQQLLVDLEGKPIRPRLALNAVGGRGATEMARLLEEGGIFRTYGGAARKAVELPVSSIVHNGVRCDGFLHPQWMRRALASDRASIDAVIKVFATLIESGEMPIFFHRFTFDQLPDAVSHALAPGTGRRAVIRFDGTPAQWDALPSLETSDAGHQHVSDVVKHIRPRSFDANRPAHKRNWEAPDSVFN